ncbi:MAG: flagellar hook protein FlgE [Sphingobacteriia bacterium]|nr:flagellar hook protein FlgE [Sphingobacteriia bacterium]NCC38994.1 flagellar hook protein FlgE [Gammaproteobacteria bacterium]
MFQQGLSGLNSSSKALDAISNNVANTSTVGYKAATARFQDVFAASSVGTVNSNQVGIGTMVSDIFYSFSQGPLTATVNALDLAISGNGFFMVERADGTVAFSRNGQFDIDRDGYIITASGERLMGFGTDPANPGEIQAVGLPVPIQVPVGGIDPRATSEVMISANLDSREALPPVQPFDPDDAETYNSVTSIQVFDSQGNPHTLSMFFIKTDVNSWTLEFTLDGTQVGDPRTLVFDTFGNLDPAQPNPLANPLVIDSVPGGALDGVEGLTIDLSSVGLTQWGSPFAVTESIQDGFSSGDLAGISVDADGRILGLYTNGRSDQILGQLLLATFRNPNGLAPLGSNLWGETLDSGARVIGAPRTGLNGFIRSGMVEGSNVDLTNELVNMIIQQRNYQANAQSIRTRDQLLQTLVNLR